MRILVSTLILLVATVAQAEQISTCKATIPNYIKGVQIAKDRFAVGEVDRGDILAAELALLDKQFDCRDILFEGYCLSAPDKAEAYLLVVTERVKYGMSETNAVYDAMKYRDQVVGRCR